MKIIREFGSDFLTLVVIGIYGWYLWTLQSTGDLSMEGFVNNVSVFLGWIVALFIAWIHLQKTRRDNRNEKIYELTKTLKIDAFREINRALRDFSQKLTHISTWYGFLPGKLKLHIENQDIFKFNRTDKDVESIAHTAELHGGSAEFILAIESNEIAVIEFDHLRKFIQQQVENLNNLLRTFEEYFRKVDETTLKTIDGYNNLKEQCDGVREQIINVQCYLHDYRIELMNVILGDVFPSKVPRRKPRDPRYKTLTEVAVKEDVEKEEERRLSNI